MHIHIKCTHPPKNIIDIEISLKYFFIPREFHYQYFLYLLMTHFADLSCWFEKYAMEDGDEDDADDEDEDAGDDDDLMATCRKP